MHILIIQGGQNWAKVDYVICSRSLIVHTYMFPESFYIIGIIARCPPHTLMFSFSVFFYSEQ